MSSSTPMKKAEEEAPVTKQSLMTNKEHFVMGEVKVEYENSYKVTSIEHQGNGHLSVRNQLGRKKGSRLVKTTQIVFQDKLIRVVDQFSQGEQYKMKPNRIGQIKSHSSKVTVHPNKTFHTYEAQEQSREHQYPAHNIFKSIIKIYVSWLDCFQNLERQFRQIKKIIEQYPSLTSSFVKRLVEKPMIADSFSTFLSTNGEQITHKFSPLGQESLADLLGNFRLFFSQKLEFQKSPLGKYFQDLEQSMSESADSQSQIRKKPFKKAHLNEKEMPKSQGHYQFQRENN